MTMTSLPLFPLRTVLFPGMTLPLHVFEDRFKLMLSTCLADGSPFGVVLTHSEEEVGGEMLPHPVGTTARVTSWREMDDGQIAVLSVGGRRFRILEYEDTEKPYLVGAVEIWDDEVSCGDDLAKLIGDIEGNLADYLILVMLLSDLALPANQFRTSSDPSPLSFGVASNLQIDLGEKQRLLEEPTAEGRLRRELVLLHREKDFLQRLVDLQRIVVDGDSPWGQSGVQGSLLSSHQ